MSRGSEEVAGTSSAALPSVAEEARALRAAAGPLVLTNLGNMLLGMVDVAVVGRLGESALAGAGLGNAIFFNVALFGFGVLFGLDPLIAQALARERRQRASSRPARRSRSSAPFRSWRSSWSWRSPSTDSARRSTPFSRRAST